MLNELKIIFLIAISFINFYTFILYYLDKKKAKKGQHRISEKKLLRFTYLFGGIGAVVGMYGIRHKTKHLKFKLSIPIALLITLGTLYFVIIY